jgi:hypothetical protein
MGGPQRPRRAGTTGQPSAPIEPAGLDDNALSARETKDRKIVGDPHSPFASRSASRGCFARTGFTEEDQSFAVNHHAARVDEDPLSRRE